MKTSLLSISLWLFSMGLLSSLTACEMRPDVESFEVLDRFRILAVQSEPPDLVSGETSTLSALVYDPDDQELSYSWSWCPARSSPRDGFICSIEESDLRAIWENLGSGKELPPYDLGSEPTAQFSNIFDAESVFGICAALIEDDSTDEFAILSCLWGLNISIELRISSGKDEWVALKTIPLIFEDKEEAKEPAQRNRNPELLPEMNLVNLLVPRTKKKPLRIEVESGTSLIEGNRYEMVARVEEEQAESFLPEKLEGVTAPEVRKETLQITWFVTKDAVNYGMDDTLFVDGASDFEDLTTQEIELAETVKSKELVLYLVIRDERDGVGWMDYRFNVEDEE